MKAIQVLTEGQHFGKIFWISEENHTARNVLDGDELVPKSEVQDLVCREVDVEYTTKTGQHLNVNVLQPNILKKLAELYKAKNAGKYLSEFDEHMLTEHSQLTIRVSGFAVRYASLTDEQRADIISRTFHEQF